MVHTLADTLAKIKGETLGNKLSNVKPKILVEILRLQGVRVTLIDVKAKRVVDTLAYKLLKENAKIVGDTRCHVETRLWSITGLRRQQEQSPRHVMTH